MKHKSTLLLSILWIFSSIYRITGFWEDTIWFIKFGELDSRTLPLIESSKVWNASHGITLLIGIIIFSIFGVNSAIQIMIERKEKSLTNGSN